MTPTVLEPRAGVKGSKGQTRIAAVHRGGALAREARELQRTCCTRCGR